MNLKSIVRLFFIFLSINTLYATCCQPSANYCADIADPIYIQQAKSAELIQDPDHLGKYLLKISGSDKKIVFFADKPTRQAGTLSLAQFLKSWQNNSFVQQPPPNAVISYVKFDPKSACGVTADVLSLSNPRYDLTYDILTFEATPLHEFEILEGKFENIVLVFDGVTSDKS